jgi:hypothetical protein
LLVRKDLRISQRHGWRLDVLGRVLLDQVESKGVAIRRLDVGDLRGCRGRSQTGAEVGYIFFEQ